MKLEKLKMLNFIQDDEISEKLIFPYVRGKIVPEDRVSVAIVGSRRITDYGAMCREKFSRESSTKRHMRCKWSCDGVQYAVSRHSSCLKGGGIPSV